VISIHGVTVLYDKATALSDVALYVEEGEIVTIIGRNGAGKSTLLRAISGLVRCHAGEITFNNARIDDMKPQDIVALGIAHAPEGRRVFRDLSVFDNLKIGAYLREDKSINDDLEKIFHRFPRLAERKSQQAGSLSGGEQQMLTIGRALMSKPKLLLLDEPSMGLSPIIVREISDIIVSINSQERVTIILVEQNSKMALNLSKRGYVLEAGRILLEGDTTDLLQDNYVKEAYLGA
jgi:branched-chain amino acid transport system ATP-binding protein